MNALPYKVLPWDSEFFDIPIARVTSDSLVDVDTIALQRWLTNRQIACTYILIEAHDDKSIRIAESLGASFVDIRLTLSVKASELGHGDGHSNQIRDTAQADLPLLEEISAHSFMQSRFYVDRHFPQEKCDDLYRIWLRKSHEGLLADRVLTILHQEQPAGFITLSDTAEHAAEIGLLAIGDDFRGHGYGHTLTKYALRQCIKEGKQTVEVVTQGANIGAQRMYQKVGFRTHRVQLWYHLWR